jgi:hypothetical protein
MECLTLHDLFLHHIHEKTLKTEINGLVEPGVLEWTRANERATPAFIVPKKDRSVRFVSDFRMLNEWFKRAPHPVPKTQALLHELEDFVHATSLNLNMG